MIKNKFRYIKEKGAAVELVAAAPFSIHHKIAYEVKRFDAKEADYGAGSAAGNEGHLQGIPRC